jgi:uncharacterized protein (DUF1800 family)
VTSSVGWSAAAHLVRSTGFGATGNLVDAVAAAGPSAWLSASLRTASDADPGAVATPPPTFEALPPLGPGASQEDRRKRRQQETERVTQLVAWWVRRMVAVENPVLEKITFGWHNHFATSATKVRSAPMLLAQNATMRAKGRGSFTELAEAMVVDPALLFWLDGQQNTAKAPNENLSREFMELFTLGRSGGYTEQDVREGARALTGWTLDRATGSAVFVPRRHDSGTKTVLGRTAALDASGFVHLLLDQPTSAPFVAARWWQLLAGSEAPPADALDRLVAAYGPERDLAGLFQAMLTDDAYAATAGSLVASPVEWVVGAMRSLRVKPDDDTVKKVATALRALGQLPFFPPNVSGWPSGQAWLSTASATTRVQTAGFLARTGDLGSVESAPPSGRLEVVAHLLGIPHFSDRTLAELTTHTDDPQRIVAMALVAPENLVI